MALLAWIPFLEALPTVERWWMLLLVPLCLGISIVYKAIRMPSLDRFWPQVAVMTLQIVLGMAGLAVGLFLLVQVVLPLLPAE